jgi:hypothetical protein
VNTLKPLKHLEKTYDLKLDAFPIEFYGPNLEVDADGCDERRCPCIIAKAQQKAGLPDT